MMVGGDDRRRLRRQHRRAVHRVVRRDDVAGQLADRDDVAGDLEQPRLRRLVGRASGGRGCRGRSTRHRSSLRRTGLVTSRSSRTWLKSICSIAIAASPSSVQTFAGPPRRRMIRESSDSTPSSRWSAWTATSPAKVSCRMSRSWSQRAASAMAPASRPPTAMPGDEQRVGRDAEGEHLAAARLGDRGRAAGRASPRTAG